ncbi:PrkA AAA domain protein [Clostridioides difficile]|nr:PrkA AAA domain protein [Clostridioides difficile]
MRFAGRCIYYFFFQAEDGIRDVERSRGLGDVYKRQLWHLLSLTQEGNFKAGRFALISADELIVAHTNETEYRLSLIHI